MSIVATASGKGGSGKSCVAAYTGIQLALSGKRVLLVELGASCRSLDLILGVQENVVFDSSDVLEGRCDAARAILPVPAHDNLFVLPGSILARLSLPGDDSSIERLLLEMRARYDYILLDGVDYSTVPVGMLDSVLMVATPDTLCVRASAQTSRRLYAAGARNMRLVINNVPSQVLPIYGVRDFDDIIDQVGAQLVGVIPASPKLQYSANNGEALDAFSLTVRVFQNLAARLQGEKRPLLIR